MKNPHKKIGAFAAAVFVAVSAAFVWSPTILTHAESATSDVNLNINAVMSLSLDANSLVLNTTPQHFVSGVITATTSTNSQYGYTLTLEDADANTKLVHTNTSVTDAFSSDFSGSKTSSEMGDNSWGFSLNAADYFKVPANGSPVALKRTTGSTTTSTEEVPVTFGVKTGNILSGAYMDEVIFTMYVNGSDGKPSDGTDPSDPGEIADACVGKNYVTNNILTDPRDGNSYTVAELADGKCWMTQNLRLVNTVITSDNSNIPDGESWTVPASSTSGFDIYEDSSDVYINETYGGYYSFQAATAGWGIYDDSTINKDSPKDICPKGWKLPTDSDYDVLAGQYNHSRDSMIADPIPGFVLNGLYRSGRLRGNGSDGYYWTSTAAPTDSFLAIRFHLSTDGTARVAYGTNRYTGMSVRCVAK